MTNLPTPGVGDVWGTQLNDAILERVPPTGGTTEDVLVKGSPTNWDMTWGTRVKTLVAGTNVSIDATDPSNPIISAATTSGTAPYSPKVNTRNDIPPVSPNTMDDEFSDGVFNTAKWSKLDTNGETYDENDFGLHVAYTANENRVRGIYQTAPSTPWEFTAKCYDVAGPDAGTARSAIGIMAGVSTTGEIRSSCIYQGNNPRGLVWSTPSSAVASWSGGTTSQSPYWYFKLGLDNSNTLTASISTNGEDWLVTATVAGFNASIVGLCWENQLNRKLTFRFAWFRRTL